MAACCKAAEVCCDEGYNLGFLSNLSAWWTRWRRDWLSSGVQAWTLGSPIRTPTRCECWYSNTTCLCMTTRDSFRYILCASLSHLIVLTLCTVATFHQIGTGREMMPLVGNYLSYSLWALIGFAPLTCVRRSAILILALGAIITAITSSAAIWNALAATEHLAVSGKPGFEKGGYEYAIMGLPMVFCAALAVSVVLFGIDQLAGKRKSVVPPPVSAAPRE